MTDEKTNPNTGYEKVPVTLPDVGITDTSTETETEVRERLRQDTERKHHEETGS